MFFLQSIVNDLIHKNSASPSSSDDSVQALKKLITTRKAILRDEIRRLEAEYRKETAELHAQQHSSKAARRLSIASLASSLSSSSLSTADAVEDAKKQQIIQEIHDRIQAEMNVIKASPEYILCDDPSAHQLVQGMKYWFIWVAPEDSA